MLTDRYGLALSTASPIARDAYVEGCDLVLTLYPGAVAAFDRAIAADPGFALAYAGRARALQMASDVAGAQATIAAPQALTSSLPERDASHVEVFSLLVGGKQEAALAAVRTHVASWPRDALVASTAANQTGLIGLSGRAGREQDQLDFLAALAPITATTGGSTATTPWRSRNSVIRRPPAPGSNDRSPRIRAMPRRRTRTRISTTRTASLMRRPPSFGPGSRIIRGTGSFAAI